VGLLEAEARELNRVFLKYIETQKPYVVLKSAMSLDGKIATYSGNSKWISCEESRQYVHTLRNELKGIMVGINTVMKDDPELTTRLGSGKRRNPVRIIVDSRGRIPLSAKILQNPHDNPVIIATTAQFPEQKRIFLEESGHKVLILPETNGQVDLISLMDELGKLKIDGILLEGGGTLNESALKSGIVDEVQFIIAPLLLGGREAITPVEGSGFETIDEGVSLYHLTTRQLGNDILVVGKVKLNNVQPSKE
jgi:diaminohydroxyphosphoribosylaminopyrimidine deaminase / 5-amino-6-(5-phosphoribosylamino)uracil reductase